MKNQGTDRDDIELALKRLIAIASAHKSGGLSPDLRLARRALDKYKALTEGPPPPEQLPLWEKNDI